MALTANQEVDRLVDQELRQYGLRASAHVYKGGFVGLSIDGYVRAFVAGDLFLGLAYEEGDNTSGADGDVNVRVFTQGDFELAIASLEIQDIGAPTAVGSQPPAAASSQLPRDFLFQNLVDRQGDDGLAALAEEGVDLAQGALVHPAHASDPAVFHGDVGRKALHAGAVDHAARPNHEIPTHGGSSTLWITGWLSVKKTPPVRQLFFRACRMNW